MIFRLREHAVQTIVLDVEGTTTPIAFVHDVLFPFARTHLRAYLRDPVAAEHLGEPFNRLHDERLADIARGEAPPGPVADYVEWLMDRDRKSPGLKILQGQIWKRGYSAGTLKGQVFRDVPPAFERWREAGINITIYSSGSVLAQRLLFGSTPEGDLTRFISAYFDTAVGAKTSFDSYRRIADKLRCPVGRMLFVSDVSAELDAARSAGYHALLCVRPGNHDQPSLETTSIHSFEEITP